MVSLRLKVAGLAAGLLLACGGSSTDHAMTGGASGVTGGAANQTGASQASGGASAQGGAMDSSGGSTNSGGAASQTGGASASSGGTASSGGMAQTTGGTDTSSGRTVPVGHCGAQQGLYFPEDSWIYTDISNASVRSNSAQMTAWLESNGGWGNSDRLQIDISFVILDADASTPSAVNTSSDPIDYSTDCDPNVDMPVPANGRIEGYSDYVCPGRTSGSPEGDCHMLVADFSSNTLFEAYQATYSGGSLYSSCTIAWDMTKDVWGSPPTGAMLPVLADRNWGIGRDCTGPDAAGFPIAPLLFTIGDVMSGKVEHAIRFALPNDRMQRAATSGDDEPVYVWPATHAGGPQAYDADAPIYGSRWRLKADFDPTARGLDPNNAVVKAVVYGLQHYGMLLADGGNIALMAEDGSDCGTTWDDLWGDGGSRVLNGIRPSDFEILDTGATDAGYDCMRNQR